MKFKHSFVIRNWGWSSGPSKRMITEGLRKYTLFIYFLMSDLIYLLLLEHLIFDWTQTWRRKWQPTPVFLRGESQGRWSLVGSRKVGNPFQTKQRSRPSCPDQEGRKGSEEGVPENLSVLHGLAINLATSLQTPQQA